MSDEGGPANVDHRTGTLRPRKPPAWPPFYLDSDESPVLCAALERDACHVGEVSGRLRTTRLGAMAGDF